MDMNQEVNILSAVMSNPSQAGYTELKEGFLPGSPQVGTITHAFRFQMEPWILLGKAGARLGELKKIDFTVSKIFNPDLSTKSFYILSWSPTYLFHARNNGPDVTLILRDENDGILFSDIVGQLESRCAPQSRMTIKGFITPDYFDRINNVSFNLDSAGWAVCP